MLFSDLEWKIIYVGSAESEEYDQTLDTVVVGPIIAGRHMFVFEVIAGIIHFYIFGLRPSDHYFRSVCWFVCLFVCAEFFSAVFDPISVNLGHMLCVWV